jgi:hypothetical protein
MSDDALDRLLDAYEHRIADRDAQEAADELGEASFNVDFERWTADVAVPALEAVVAKLTARSHHADIETRAAGRWDPPYIRLNVVMRGLPARVLTFEAEYRSNVISVVQGGTGLPSTGIGADSIQTMTTEKVNDYVSKFLQTVLSPG